MKYNALTLEHFFNPHNVGVLDARMREIGSAIVGSRENGALIHLQIQVNQQRIKAARFKAYGACPIIAGCSYATEWVVDKTLAQATQRLREVLIQALAIPKLKVHYAVLIEEALRVAIANYLATYL